MRQIKVESKVSVIIILNDDDPISLAEKAFRQLISDGFEWSHETYDKLKLDDVRVEEVRSPL